MKKLLITDLDNTLYDWVSFYAQSFSAMFDKLVEILEVSRDELTNDFKKVHLKHGNSEYPFATLELESVKRKFNGVSKEIILSELDEAFHAFNSVRKRTLVCYPGVLDTLEELKSRGVVIVGHTEAPVRNALFRLESLGLKKYLKHLYAPNDRYYDDLDQNSKNWVESYGDFIFKLSEDEKKPNPNLLGDICYREGVDLKDAIYVGDSIIKDISMANSAGIESILASYGKQHNPEYWDVLVSITHWSEDDVQRETKLKELYSHVIPTYSIDKFCEILEVI
ncbi:HAD family hydrolase [Klebsiella aerogenes]|uniref:HAD family hydrolase n=2 Tax=Enterobacterales TaxID=91347 RepID=UPI003A8E3127